MLWPGRTFEAKPFAVADVCACEGNRIATSGFVRLTKSYPEVNDMVIQAIPLTRNTAHLRLILCLLNPPRCVIASRGLVRCGGMFLAAD